MRLLKYSYVVAFVIALFAVEPVLGARVTKQSFDDLKERVEEIESRLEDLEKDLGSETEYICRSRCGGYFGGRLLTTDETAPEVGTGFSPKEALNELKQGCKDSQIVMKNVNGRLAKVHSVGKLYPVYEHTIGRPETRHCTFKKCCDPVEEE